MNAAAVPDFSIEAFERSEIDPDKFDHEAHVYVAWLYLEQFPQTEALEKFDSALKRLTEKLGAGDKYHVTITWFFLLLIGERRNADPGANWQRFRWRNPDLFEGGVLLKRYYTGQTLASGRARQTFVLPDRIINGEERAA